MGSRLTTSVFFGGILFLAACQQEETFVVSPPVFDKYGNGGCVGGNGQTVYVPGANFDSFPPCDDVCTDGGYTDANGNSVAPCPPPPPRREGDDDSSTQGGNNPTGGPIN